MGWDAGADAGVCIRGERREPGEGRHGVLLWVLVSAMGWDARV